MYPPAPSPVRSGSQANDASIAPSAASTALPPARNASAPADALTGWPAATTPNCAPPAVTGSASGNEFRHVELRAAADAADPRLSGRFAQPPSRLLLLGARPGRERLLIAAAGAGIPEAGGHDRHPDLVVELFVD